MNPLGAFFCFRQGWKKHGGQDGDNGNDDQEFNQREPTGSDAQSLRWHKTRRMTIGVRWVWREP
jgi:hypothetical protein